MTSGLRSRSILWRFLALCFFVSALFVLSVNLWIALPPVPPDSTADEAVAYFAYGSNMNDRYISRVRGITRASSELATLPGYSIQFNLDGIDRFEPSFANLATDPDAIAYGIMHRLPAGEFEKIVASEGVGYSVRDVKVRLADGSTVIAKTLISKPNLNHPRMPSRRYLGYLHEAAKAYEFPPNVVEAYNPEKGAYYPVISEAFGAVIQTVVWITARM